VNSVKRTRWLVEFYKDDRGVSPVDEFLDGLQPDEVASVIMHIDLLQEYGISLRMPYARDLKGHKPLWELRPKSIRLLYFLYEGIFIILHGCRKKKRKAFNRDIAIAENRMAEYLERKK
jgi:phage-related protein